MTVGARLGVDVCNASRGCEENEKIGNDGSILQCTRVGLGEGDLTRPGVRPGKGEFARGELSSFVPRARVSVFEFTMLGSRSCTCVLGDRGGCGIVPMGWNPRLGVRGRVYAPAFCLFGIYAHLCVLLGCIHGFLSVY